MKLYKRNLYRYIKGMSLIEVMVAMTLGLLLLSGAMSLFINNKRVYRQNDQSARLQESARLTMELLRKDIRRAGFIGCHDSIDNLTNLINTPAGNGSLYDMFVIIGANRISLAIEGLDNAINQQWAPSGNTALVAVGAAVGQRVVGANANDAITIRYLEGESWPVLADNDNDPAVVTGFPANVGQPVVVSTMANHPGDGRNNDLANNFIGGEILGISDCNNSLLFQTGNVANGQILPANNASNITPGNTTDGQFNLVYGDGASVRRYRAVRYYIGNGAYGGPSLFRQTIVTNTAGAAPQGQVVSQELVEGVEAMRILYGNDTDGNGTADDFISAQNINPVGNWGNVVSVRIAVLIRTVNQEFTDDPDVATYALMDVNFDPPDLRVQRRVFETIVQLRNRIVD